MRHHHVRRHNQTAPHLAPSKSPYDEGWDDDVYYAAATVSGGIGLEEGRIRESSDRSTVARIGAVGNVTDDLMESATTGSRMRSPTERRYMKVPNMRRSLRPTAGESTPRASDSSTLREDEGHNEKGKRNVVRMHLHSTGPAPPNSPPKLECGVSGRDKVLTGRPQAEVGPHGDGPGGEVTEICDRPPRKRLLADIHQTGADDATEVTPSPLGLELGVGSPSNRGARGGGVSGQPAAGTPS
ncbi:unnamed protein product [Discosporangium mesarthrocarpum]